MGYFNCKLMQCSHLVIHSNWSPFNMDKSVSDPNDRVLLDLPYPRCPSLSKSSFIFNGPRSTAFFSRTTILPLLYFKKNHFSSFPNFHWWLTHWLSTRLSTQSLWQLNDTARWWHFAELTCQNFCSVCAGEERRIEWVLQLWSCHSMIWQTEHQLCILFNFQHSICRHIFFFFLYSSSFYVSDPLTDSPVHKNSPRLIPHPFAHSNQTSFRPSLLCHGKISCIMWLMCANRMPSSSPTRSWSPLPHLALLHSGGEEVRMNQDIFIKKAPLTTKKNWQSFPFRRRGVG